MGQETQRRKGKENTNQKDELLFIDFLMFSTSPNLLGRGCGGGRHLLHLVRGAGGARGRGARGGGAGRHGARRGGGGHRCQGGGLHVGGVQGGGGEDGRGGGGGRGGGR